MGLRRALLLLVLAVRFGNPSEAHAWRAKSLGVPAAIVTDAASDVVVAGLALQDAGDSADDFVVTKRSTSDGRKLWDYVLPSPGPTRDASGAATALALDSAGDVVAAGYPDGNTSELTVVKLAGANGTERWRNTLGTGIPQAVAVDGADDVVVAGDLDDLFFVTKLDGATGTEVWRTVLPGGSQFGDLAGRLVVAADGDAIAAGTVAGSFAVVRLFSADGGERWRFAAGDGQAFALAPCGTDEVVAAGYVGGEALAVRIDARSGQERWRVAPPMFLSDAACDSVGDVVVGGSTVTRLTVAKLGGTDGRELWHRRAMPGGVVALAVAPSGDIWATGFLERRTGQDFGVLGLSGTRGTVFARRRLDGDHDHIDSDGATDVSVDGRGRPAVAGYVYDAEGSRMVVLRLPRGRPAVSYTRARWR